MNDELTPSEPAVTEAQDLAPAVIPAVSPVVEKPDGNVAVTALMPEDMAQAHHSLIAWCQHKLAVMRAEAEEYRLAFEHAKQRKWKTETLRQAFKRTEARVFFYEKMLAALEHGYVPVPNFPVTAFAIRTAKDRPQRLWTTEWRKSHVQQTEPLPAGEGEYQNPFPMVEQYQLEPPTATKSEVCSYWAEAWKELDFPITMAKPQIMEATTRAMALKIFDDIGMLPGFNVNEQTRPPRGDPMIIARILDPRKTGYGGKREKFVSFMIAWHLDTRDL